MQLISACLALNFQFKLLGAGNSLIMLQCKAKFHIHQQGDVSQRGKTRMQQLSFTFTSHLALTPFADN